MSFETDPAQNKNRQLHICPACDSGLVQPQMWQKSDGPDGWRIWLRCPECEWTEDDVFSSNEIDEFDAVLDAGVQVLDKSLEGLTRNNMEELVGSFAVALSRDLIGADDFLPHRR